MGIWDSVMDWFLDEEKPYDYDEKALKEREDSFTNHLREMEKLAHDKRLEEANAGLGKVLPGIPEKDYMEIPDINDDELFDSANDKYRDEHKDENDKLDNSYNSNKDKLVSGAEKATEKYVGDKIKLTEDSADDIENFKNKAIKNGIVDSTIVGEVNENIAGKLEEKLTGKNEVLKNELTDIESKINALNKKKNDDGKKLSSAQASDIEKELASLKTARDKNIKKAEKYNSDVDKEIAKAEADRYTTTAKYWENFNATYDQLQKDEDRNGLKGERKKEYDKRLQIAIGYYKQYPQKIAKELASSNKQLPNLLGANYKKFRTYVDGLK